MQTAKDEKTPFPFLWCAMKAPTKRGPSCNIEQETPFKRWWNSLGFIQKRLIRFCASLLVMVICFPLYYLGLFGSVEGPLNPAHLGEKLAGMGVTKTTMLVFFVSLVIISVSWNWIYTLCSLLIGSRLTCNARIDQQGTPCGAAAKRNKVLDRTTGRTVRDYVCIHGHRRTEAHFHPAKKRTFSHTLWVLAVAFFLIVFFHSGADLSFNYIEAPFP